MDGEGGRKKRMGKQEGRRGWGRMGEEEGGEGQRKRRMEEEGGRDGMGNNSEHTVVICGLLFCLTKPLQAMNM